MGNNFACLGPWPKDYVRAQPITPWPSPCQTRLTVMSVERCATKGQLPWLAVTEFLPCEKAQFSPSPFMSGNQCTKQLARRPGKHWLVYWSKALSHCQLNETYRISMHTLAGPNIVGIRSSDFKVGHFSPQKWETLNFIFSTHRCSLCSLIENLVMRWGSAT